MKRITRSQLRKLIAEAIIPGPKGGWVPFGVDMTLEDADVYNALAKLHYDYLDEHVPWQEIEKKTGYSRDRIMDMWDRLDIHEDINYTMSLDDNGIFIGDARDV